MTDLMNSCRRCLPGSEDYNRDRNLPFIEEAPYTDGGPLRIHLEDVSSSTAQAISQLENAEVVLEDADIIVTAEGKRHVLYLKNKALLCQVESRKQLLARLALQVRVKKLLGVEALPKQHNIFLGVATDKGVLVEGDVFGVEMSSAKKSYLVLINVDSGGMVDVIYSYYARELQPGRGFSFGDMGRVEGPHFGTEYLIGIAYSAKPGFWNSIPKMLEKKQGEQFGADDPFIERLLRSTTSPGFAGATVVSVKTSSRENIVKE